MFGLTWDQVRTFFLHYYPFVTVPIAVLSGIVTVTITLYRFFSERKGLFYGFDRVERDTNMASAALRRLGELDGRSLGRGHVAQVWETEIRNSGNQPIKRDDFDAGRPITVTVAGAKLDFACVAQAEPTNLTVALEPPNWPVPPGEAVRTSVAIRPLLLNAKDTIRLQLVLTPPYTAAIDVRVDARIAGIKRASLGLPGLAQFLEDGTQTTSGLFAVLFILVLAAEQRAGATLPYIGGTIAHIEASITQINAVALGSVVVFVWLAAMGIELVIRHWRELLRGPGRWLRRFG